MLTLALSLLLARDLEWERIQVEWIAETRTVRSLEDVIPHRDAELIRLLGDDRYLVRRLAAAELARMGEAGSLALAWGMRVKSPAISEASEKLRALLYVCRHCGGTGDCPACLGTRVDAPFKPCVEHCGWKNWCRACEGSGDVRCKLAYHEDLWEFEWHPGHPGYLPVERDLFGAEVDQLIASDESGE